MSPWPGKWGIPCASIANPVELVCLRTTTLRGAPLYRLSLPAGPDTGLHAPSRVMVDKIMAVRRDRCGAPIGRVDEAALVALGRVLALAVGIAE